MKNLFWRIESIKIVENDTKAARRRRAKAYRQYFEEPTMQDDAAGTVAFESEMEPEIF